MSNEGEGPVPEPDDEWVVAAFHQGGHAVAAVMRGGESSLAAVTLDDHVCGGFPWARYKRWDEAFIIWAGIWAEARHAWEHRPADEKDDLDDYVTRVLVAQLGESDDYARAVAAHDAEMPPPPETDVSALRSVSEREVWPLELERVWPAIERVAALLLAGEPVTYVVVRDIIDRYRQE